MMSTVRVEASGRIIYDATNNFSRLHKLRNDFSRWDSCMELLHECMRMPIILFNWLHANTMELNGYQFR
jgi:hypothetical protein